MIHTGEWVPLFLALILKLTLTEEVLLVYILSGLDTRHKEILNMCRDRSLFFGGALPR